MNKTLSPPKPARVSVPVSGEVLEAFQRLARAGNMSTGKAMAQWLEDTIDAAQFMAQTLEKARQAPKMVARELHAYALGLGDETGRLLETVKAMSAGQRAEMAADRGGLQRARGAGSSAPPSCNTGGKVPPKHATKSSKGGSVVIPYGWTEAENNAFIEKSLAVVKREQAAKGQRGKA